MMKLIPYRYFSFFLALGFTACSSSYTAMQGESDDMYFMASDEAAATAHAVPNNTPGHFEDYALSDEKAQENFSAKNVNPEYIAKYQVQSDSAGEDIVYFDDAPAASTEGKEGDVNVYNNFYGYNNPRGSQGSSWNSNPWMFNSMGMMGFNPRFGYGGFYDPFWGSPFAFRPGLNISLGLGFGFGRPWGFNRPFYGGFYDPFYDPFWGPGLAYSPYSRFYGYGGGYYNRPIIINNLYSGEGRNLVRAARTRRGSTLSRDYRESRAAVAPNTSRTVARRSAVSRTARSRGDVSDFSRSENDYYNSRTSAAPTRRSINSAAMTTRSNNDSRTSSDSYTPPRRSSRPSVTQPSEGRSRSNDVAPRSRSTSPSYNRSTSPSRSRDQNISTPSRTRSSSYTPSRSSSSSRSSSFSSGSSSSRSSGGSTSGSSGRSRRGGN